MRTFLRQVLLLVLLAGSLSAVPAFTSAPAQAAAPPERCFSAGGGGGTQSHQVCYKFVRRLARNYKIGYRDSLVNATNREAEIRCTAEQSETFTYGLSITVSAKVKATLFVDLEASVTANVEKSMSSGVTVLGRVKVPPRTTTYCDRVTYHERFRIRRCVVWRGDRTCKYVTMRAPSRNGWRFHDAPN